ncbi:uncharacterized protein LOC128815576 [Vidua macroura]|uniref:uncharacterized protein LOC128815576 n=1 Tax=Vidua macroura TaxID=187451 RepID=UPI0023A8CC81|nr:uncharacterized protein LOC128815576 [Vidua macroura]
MKGNCFGFCLYESARYPPQPPPPNGRKRTPRPTSSGAARAARSALPAVPLSPGFPAFSRRFPGIHGVCFPASRRPPLFEGRERFRAGPRAPLPPSARRRHLRDWRFSHRTPRGKCRWDRPASTERQRSPAKISFIRTTATEPYLCGVSLTEPYLCGVSGEFFFLKAQPPFIRISLLFYPLAEAVGSSAGPAHPVPQLLEEEMLTPIATFCRDISEEKPHPAAEASPSNTRWYQSSTQAQPRLDLKKKKKGILNQGELRYEELAAAAYF